MTAPNNHNMTSQAVGKSFMIAFMIIPTAISIFVALEVKNVSTVTSKAINYEPQIVCFDPDICAIEVYGKWYRIDGVIVQEDIVPEEYLLDELMQEAHEERLMDVEIVDETKKE